MDEGSFVQCLSAASQEIAEMDKTENVRMGVLCDSASADEKETFVVVAGTCDEKMREGVEEKLAK